MNNSKYGKAGTGSITETATIPVDQHLRSSCFPLEKVVKEIVLDIRNKDLMPSMARVYDTAGKLLFNINIHSDTVVLSTGRLKDCSGIIRFSNNYAIYIN